MKKWLAVGFITTYLGALSWGMFAHTAYFMQNSHPSMYYVVWDMFCGWSAYSNRYHVVAEGESGQWYRLTPMPWGSFRPFGDLEREHYDAFCAHFGAITQNVLRNTEHEPITRVFVVEETWSKKYNMSQDLWRMRFGTEKPETFTKYHRVRRVFAGDGTPLHSYTPWNDYQYRIGLADNPRLVADSRRGTSFYAPPARWMPAVQEMDVLVGADEDVPSGPAAPRAN